ncbi:MAG: hypothetical protein AAB300_04220 [Nitrospirota bacterium]
MPYDSEQQVDSDYKSPHPCDHCGADDEPTHAVQTGDGFVVVCKTCRAEVVGGS